MHLPVASARAAPRSSPSPARLPRAARPHRPTRPDTFPGADATLGEPSPWRRVVLVALAVAALVLVASADTLHEGVVALTDAAVPIMRQHPLLGVVVFVVLSALSAMLAFFSGAVLIPVAAQVWGLGGTIGLLWLGWTLGGVCAWGLARLAGRPLVATMVSAEALARYETRVSASTPLGLVVLFQLGVPSELCGYLLGLARYPFGRYLVALAVAELPWAVLTALMGTTLVERRVPLLAGAGAAAAVLSGVAFWQVHRRLRATRGQRPQSTSGER